MIKMVKVQCEKCGNVQDTFGKWYWICNRCGHKQLIKDTLLNKEEKPEITKPVSVEVETEKESVEIEKEESPEKPKNEPQIIEEKVEFEEEKEEEYFCPVCGAKVEKYKDCSNCGAVLIWERDDDG